MAKKIPVKTPQTGQIALGRARNTAGFLDLTSGFAQAYQTEPGINVRSPMSRTVYEQYRPNERIPTGSSQEDLRSIMTLSRSAYERVGVIRSVVDMMSEFGAEGIEILHEDAGPHAFYKEWSKRVLLEDRAERFLSWLYKAGNVVVRRTYAKLSKDDIKKVRQDETTLYEGKGNGRIPLEYTFYDPATIELVGEKLGTLARKKRYGLRIPYSFIDGIRSPRTPLEREIYNSLPEEIRFGLEGKSDPNGVYVLPISPDRLHVSFYKKDDSDLWGKSFIYSILEDVFYNDKLKLAKTSSLDSWYNFIRVWKVGDHKAAIPIAPSPEAGQKLAQLIEANVGGGGGDFIWDSAIDVQELYPPVDKLQNFEENTHNILLGLGVPEGLVGGKATGSAGMTQNYLGLKNLIKRLEAGRRALKIWLEEEVDIIQKEMGFKKRPIIRFAHTDLHDEQTYFNLLVQLLDRNVISDTTVLERIDEIPEIERRRIKLEEAAREEGNIPEKASPFHKPELEMQQQHEIKKITHQAKTNLEYAPPTTGPDNSSNVQKRKNKSEKKGRPSGVKDSVTRQRRGNKIKSPRASLLVEANRIYDAVDAYIKKQALEVYNITTARQLTAVQEQSLDEIRLAAFAHIPPYSPTDEASIIKCMQEQMGPLDEFLIHYQTGLASLQAKDSITFETKRILRTSAYADAWCIDNDEDI